MRDFLLSAEKTLFSYRLSCMTEQELLRAVKPLRKLSNDINTHLHLHKNSPHQGGLRCNTYVAHQEEALNILHFHQNERILNKALSDIGDQLYYLTFNNNWKTLLSLYANGVTEKYIVMPFQHCLHLVAKREVNLINGYAYVPCSKLCDMLISLFVDLLRYGLELAKKRLSIVNEDIRMARLLLNLKVREFNGVIF